MWSKCGSDLTWNNGVLMPSVILLWADSWLPCPCVLGELGKLPCCAMSEPIGEPSRAGLCSNGPRHTRELPTGRVIWFTTVVICSLVGEANGFWKGCCTGWWMNSVPNLDICCVTPIKPFSSTCSITQINSETNNSHSRITCIYANVLLIYVCCTNAK